MKIKKILVTMVAALLLMTMTVMGTLAYLTATSEEVVNTFSVGKVAIDLDEANVDVYGAKVDETRVKANNYKLMPGHKYVKDPTVTVKADSEESYIRMQVTVTKLKELDEIFKPTGADLATIFVGNDQNIWTLKKTTRDTAANTVTYEFWYHKTVNTLAVEKTETTEAKAAADLKLAALFTHVQVPGNITNKQLDTIKDMTITAVAHAIQADGFTDADAAWAAFDAP